MMMKKTAMGRRSIATTSMTATKKGEKNSTSQNPHLETHSLSPHRTSFLYQAATAAEADRAEAEAAEEDQGAAAAAAPVPLLTTSPRTSTSSRSSAATRDRSPPR